MPTYTNTPPANTHGHGIQIERVPAGRPYKALSISPDVIGTRTHFWGGRTMPCESPDCKACAAAVPWRWHSYHAVIHDRSAELFLLELTAQATERLIAYRSAHGTLRGCMIRAHRANYARNSRIHIDCQPTDLTNIIMPPAPDLIHALAVMWHLPLPALQPTGRGGLGDAIETASDLAHAGDLLPIGPYAEALTHRILAPTPIGGNGDGP
jgi:hypothetical protein